MKIVSEIQRKNPAEREASSICITSHLSEEQRREIEALGRACRAWEPVTQEPFLDSEENVDSSIPCFYIYYENTFPISFVSLFIPDGTYAEVTGFTLPGYRKKGHFNELLACAKEELKDRNLEYYIVSDGKGPDACAMLEHKGLEAAYSEMMMAMPMDELAEVSVKRAGAEDYVGDASEDMLAEFEVFEQDDEYVMERAGQRIGGCRLAFFSGTAYLYGFEIEENLRQQGYGRLFLKLLAKCQPEEIHTMLLQVGSRNEAACALYRSCGFAVTEKLTYYKI